MHFSYSALDKMPDFKDPEEVIHYFQMNSNCHCPDKIRMFLIESHGIIRGFNGSSLKDQATRIAEYDYCLMDDHFETGWIDRDGTCRSNSYAGHSLHLGYIGLDYNMAERMGWIHVSYRACTAYFEPSKAQMRVIERLGDNWNGADRTLPKFVPLKKNVPIREQMSALTDAVIVRV